MFMLFWKEDDSATQSLRQTLDAVLVKRVEKAAVAHVHVSDPAEKALIDRLALNRSPMPLVLAFAPNGAITGVFPLKLTEQDVASAFVSPGMASCLKGTQRVNWCSCACNRNQVASYRPASGISRRTASMDPIPK